MPEPLLLDTHCWLWYAGGLRTHFEGHSWRRIERACLASDCYLSIISVWEVGLLASKGRLRPKRPVQGWLAEMLERSLVRIAPISIDIALESSDLPGSFHADFADRLIVATARCLGATLVTQDEAILRYGREKHCRTLAC